MLTSMADYQVQRAAGKPLDLQRSAFFCAFGLYSGLAQWLVYVSLFARLFPGAIRFANLPWSEKLRSRQGAGQLAGQIVADLAVYVPFVYYPVFYVFQGLFREDSMTTSLTRYMDNFFVDWGANVAFWAPGDIVCFGAPAWMRMPISHLGGFGWNSILSWLRGEVGETRDAPTRTASAIDGSCTGRTPEPANPLVLRQT